MDYYDIYRKRLNRYGNDFQSRIQAQRERDFENKLLKSVYYVEFEYESEVIPATLEPYKQDETETLQYLLTRVNINLPAGAVLMLKDKDDIEKPYMVWYIEHIKASGYNRYIMLRMTHNVSWIDREGNSQTSWAYMYGQENNMLKDEIRSRSRMDTIYSENLKASFFVLPRSEYIKKDIYFIVGATPFQEYYRVTGYDIQSTPGVQYVTIDPVYEFDLTPAPQKQPTDNDEDYYWLEGGN